MIYKLFALWLVKQWTKWLFEFGFERCWHLWGTILTIQFQKP